MKRVLLKLILASATAAVMNVTAAAASDSEPHVVALSYGVTNIDLGALPAMAVLGRRENFNGHSFDVLTLYVNAPAAEGEQTVWHIVPLLQKEKETLELHASGGADCMLHDFRLVAPVSGTSPGVVVADREIGQHFAAPAPVTFKYYELRKNDEGVPGRPLYYFELIETRRAEHRYCDVGEAFSKEMKLGPYMQRP